MDKKDLKKVATLLLTGTLAMGITGCATEDATDKVPEEKIEQELEVKEEKEEEITDVEFDVAEWIIEGENTILNFDEKADQPSQTEIEKMLDAAVKAPTGLNLQHYWYTVVTDYDTQMELATTPETRPTKGTVMFILSVKEDGSEKSLGLTMSHLTLAAQGMGYGSHIYGEPAYNLSQEDFSKFDIPEGYTPSEFIIVGKSDTVDASSNATPGSRENNWNFYEVK